MGIFKLKAKKNPLNKSEPAHALDINMKEGIRTKRSYERVEKLLEKSGEKNCGYYYQASINSGSGNPSHINTRYFEWELCCSERNHKNCQNQSLYYDFTA